ncbi:hypothetical protein DFH06DRAFT_1297233 [Mycena polygramma]|nr:hypothetical protein DFH06DRAFT_1297233 [Mycena polygramma]
MLGYGISSSSALNNFGHAKAGMHHCLTIPELVGMICGELHPDTSSGTLAALAVTSRAFQDPALDLLWKNQMTLLNFLKCMPADLFSVYDTPAAVGRRRPIVPFLRARSLAFVHVSSTEHESVERFYVPQSGGSPLHNHPSKDFQYLRLFLSPRLEHIELSFNCSGPDLSLMSTLPSRCPGLKHVELYSAGSGSPSATASLCKLLDGLRHLESLVFNPPDTATLLHIGQFQRLKRLTIGNLRHGTLPSSSAGVPLFSCIRDFSLFGSDVEPATNLFSCCVNTSFDSISIGFQTPVTATALDSLFTSIAACQCSHTSLSSLTVSMDIQISDNIHNATPYLITPYTLRHLFCFKNLMSLRLTAIGFDMDDAIIGEMARSWLQLRTLKFVAYPHSIRPRATLKSLQLLAQHCCHLESLEIIFDATVPPTLDDSVLPPMQKTLTSLNVGSSTISVALQVARFISGIFPSLDELSTFDNDNFEALNDLQLTVAEVERHNRLWGEVQGQLPIVRAIREEGRKWSQVLLPSPPKSHSKSV